MAQMGSAAGPAVKLHP